MIDPELKSYIELNLQVFNSLDSELKTRRNLQHFSLLKPSNRRLSMLYEVALHHAISAEKACPGSGLVFLKLLCGQEVSTNSKIKNKFDFLRLLKNLNIKQDLYDMLSYVIDVADINSSIVIKKSNNQSYVEVIEGHQFELLNMLPTSSTTFLPSCKVACIDGYVESVSELHHIFTELADKKYPCLIFSRGLSEDVLHTIKVNNDRRTMQVYPFVIPFDVDNVNDIIDLAVTSGTDVIASTKGQLISSISLSSLGSIDNCYISNGKIKFSNSSSLTRKRVKEHCDYLKNLCLERPEISEIVMKRVKSLTSSRIEIGIPNDINFYSNQQQLDEAIRIIMSVFAGKYDPYGYAKLYLKSYSETNSLESIFLLCHD